MYYTERLMLRALDPKADEATMLRWLNDEDYMWAVRFDTPRPAVRDFIAKFFERLTTRTDGLPSFGICEKPEDGEDPSKLSSSDDYFLKDGKPRYPLIGNLNFHSKDFSFSNSVVSFGILVDREHQDRGYGTEILMWAMEFAFNSLNLHKVELEVATWNPRAIHVYEKIGFVHEGKRREVAFRKGKRYDAIMMGLLKPEWESKRSTSTLPSLTVD